MSETFEPVYDIKIRYVDDYLGRFMIWPNDTIHFRKPAFTDDESIYYALATPSIPKEGEKGYDKWKEGYLKARELLETTNSAINILERSCDVGRITVRNNGDGTFSLEDYLGRKAMTNDTFIWEYIDQRESHPQECGIAYDRAKKTLDRQYGKTVDYKIGNK